MPIISSDYTCSSRFCLEYQRVAVFILFYHLAFSLISEARWWSCTKNWDKMPCSTIYFTGDRIWTLDFEKGIKYYLWKHYSCSAHAIDSSFYFFICNSYLCVIILSIEFNKRYLKRQQQRTIKQLTDYGRSSAESEIIIPGIFEKIREFSHPFRVTFIDLASDLVDMMLWGFFIPFFSSSENHFSGREQTSSKTWLCAWPFHYRGLTGLMDF